MILHTKANKELLHKALKDAEGSSPLFCILT